jgi:hypothetical protein
MTAIGPLRLRSTALGSPSRAFYMDYTLTEWPGDSTCIETCS